MKIAILSDTHDNIPNVKQVLATIEDMKPKAVLFCGDFCAPFITIAFAETLSMPIHAVFGNNDGDRFAMAMKTKDFPHMNLHGEYATLNLGGKRIGMTHYPFYAEVMAKSGDFDLVAFGHDHTARILNFGNALAINPGAVMVARNGNPPSFALYDTDAHAATLHALDGSFLTI